MTDSLRLSAKEAAERLGIGLTTTYKLLRLGRLRAVRIGTRPNYRIPLWAIAEALEDPERLGIGLTTTYKLLRLGRLRAVRIGTRPNYRIPLWAIAEALEAAEWLSITGEERELQAEDRER